MSRGTQSTSILIAAILHLVKALHKRKKGMQRGVRLKIENQISMLIHQIAEIHMAVKRNEIMHRDAKSTFKVEISALKNIDSGDHMAHDLSETITLLKLWEFNDPSVVSHLEEKLRYLQQYYH
ncbi:hypothetical protein I6N90_13815 [Paenibacillus sp. GSMTC-2017]|uniref:hypothetical protein n=1 Tax=Paenibacillus sp. GSMTC-2017 TaxID=2794350 RepID=UPI0018D90743|nr:hypothetical protein [Paenibacillus sp. GSMTC-2017]MBH5318877.1 hypothetical protein [Paenibacillus sp. GSMTC-2017]